MAPIGSLGKHWTEVLNVFILQALKEYSPEGLAAFMIKWRHDRVYGPRDSVGTPGTNADFVIEGNECHLMKVHHDPKKKGKLIAKAWQVPFVP